MVWKNEFLCNADDLWDVWNNNNNMNQIDRTNTVKLRKTEDYNEGNGKERNLEKTSGANV